MLRVAEHVQRTDTGRQRRANEDALFARSPLFAVADGMGGAQAGEVASHTVVEVLEHGLPAGEGTLEERLVALVRDANARVHELSRADEARAGMGTTLTLAYVDDEDVAFAHVGDSRAYRLRGDDFQRLTQDHSLVEELVRQGKLTPEEADEHPQRSIITRALGPEDDVEVDTTTWPAQAGDRFLICSDGLTSMVPEARVGEIVRAEPDLAVAAEALIEAANAAGGRDNITVVLFRLEDVGGKTESSVDQPTMAGTASPRTADVHAALAGSAPPEDEPQPSSAGSPGDSRAGDLPASQPRQPRPGPAAADGQRAPGAGRSTSRRRRRRRRALRWLAAFMLIGVPILLGIYIASQSVYFLGIDGRSAVTVYRGLPYELPAGIRLYTSNYVSGVTAAELTPAQRARLLDHRLRSHDDAADLARQLELGRLTTP
jgi:protein phosphatase